MKKFNKIYIAAVAAGMVIGLSSCHKDFDPKSYAPPLNISGFTSSDEIAKESLVAHWSFNGDLKDNVGGAAGVNTGTAFAPGVKGQALQGAANSYVLAEPSTAVKELDSFTLTEWINTPAPSNGIIGIFSLAKTNAFWGNIEMFIENGSNNDNGKLRIHIAKGADDKTIVVDNAKNLFSGWVNIGVSYNQTDGTYKVYVNGSSVKDGKIAGLTGPLDFVNVGKVVFGCVQFQTTPSQTSSTGKQDWASYLTGNVDEVRIYNKALTDTEVNAIVKLEGRGK